MSSPSMEDAMAALPFTRIVHFTPALNLIPIFRDGLLRSSKDLAENSPEQFTPTDRKRFDRFPDHLCCSFEYPNAYYQHEAKNKPEYINYPDWVCLILDRKAAATPGALFAPCNAALHHGAYAKEGGGALLGCWATVAGPKHLRRKTTQNPSVPTDLQTEVLVPAPVSLTEVSAIITQSPRKARELFGVLQSHDLDPGRVQWRSAPLFYERYNLRDAIWANSPIDEMTWTPASEDLA